MIVYDTIQNPYHESPTSVGWIWKRFAQFEQTYGDLASMLKVEQRRKEALSRTGDDGAVALEDSIQDVISRYSFMDLWPCSPKDLDHLARQTNMNKKAEKPSIPNAAGGIGEGRGTSGLSGMSDQSSKVVYPDIAQMVIYEPGQKPGPGALPSGTAVTSSTMSSYDGILKAAPPALVAFIANLPVVEGPAPDVDLVLSICLQSNTMTGQAAKQSTSVTQGVAAPSISEPSGTNKSRPVPSGSSVRMTRPSVKKKDADSMFLCWQDDDEMASVQSVPLPKDVFRIRQMQKACGGTTSQTGSTSYGSAFSGEHSGSTS
ncbi:hypothetical protein Cgig2_030843 [Carnegiea gigantea]|uniref:Suppressor of forked domain-containing protein n=1 Tax=Carnegiea gigantea TaxID=171969 RepID=A0A9Q1JKM5_9CARY|nr:hypothetical protein Cgig2_030843 [Carnegiea gigantea]